MLVVPPSECVPTGAECVQLWPNHIFIGLLGPVLGLRVNHALAELLDQVETIESTRNKEKIFLDLLRFSVEVDVVQSAEYILVQCVEISILITLGRCEHDCCSILQGVLSDVLLDEVQVFLEEFCSVAIYGQKIYFVADDEDRNAEVNFEDAGSERHLNSDILDI